MTTSVLEYSRRTSSPSPMPTGAFIMYAITFDMDTDILKKHYGSSYNNAYNDIRNVLLEHGFTWQQGSVYFGDSEKVNAVTCTLAVLRLAKMYSWFGPSIRDIRLLRISEQQDLLDAINEASK